MKEGLILIFATVLLISCVIDLWEYAKKHDYKGLIRMGVVVLAAYVLTTAIGAILD